MTIKTMLENIVGEKLTESTETFKTVLADKVKDKLQEKKQTFAKSIFTEAADYSEVEAITESLYEDKDHDSIDENQRTRNTVAKRDRDGSLEDGRNNISPIFNADSPDKLANRRIPTYAIKGVAKFLEKDPKDIEKSQQQKLKGKLLAKEDKDHDSIEPDDDADDKEFLKHPKHQLDLIASYTKNKPEEDYEMTKAGVPSMHSVKAKEARGDVDNAPKFTHKNGEVSNPSKEEAHHILSHIDQMKPELRTKVFHVMHSSKDGFAKVAAALNTLPAPKSNSIYSK
jgi:hypothetical protein